MRPGTVIVFEGLDRAGKSTQLERLKMSTWTTPAPTFAHMPTGLTSLTRSIYSITERETIISPLARQLLHLACHAENMDALVAGRDTGGLVLDRWWWSTMAYGWFGGKLDDLGVEESVFHGLVDAVWSRLSADVVLLFTTPYEPDELNRDEVLVGYGSLAAAHPLETVVVPPANPDATAKFVMALLRERNLIQGGT